MVDYIPTGIFCTLMGNYDTSASSAKVGGCVYPVRYDNNGNVPRLEIGPIMSILRHIPFTTGYTVYEIDNLKLWTILGYDISMPTDRYVLFPSCIKKATGYVGYLCGTADLNFK